MSHHQARKLTPNCLARRRALISACTFEQLEQRRLLAGVKILSASFEFESAQQVKLTFDQDVQASLSAADLTLDNVTTDAQFAPTSISLASYVNNGNGTYTGTFAFGNGLGSGNYRASVWRSDVTNSSGEGLVKADGTTPTDFGLGFFVLGGDANRDRHVDMGDFAILASNFNQSPRTFSQGDFNYDGIVNIGDQAILFSAFNSYLPAAPAGPDEISVAVLGPKAVYVDWFDVSTGETGHRVQMSDDGVNWSGTHLTQWNVAAHRQSFKVPESAIADGTRPWFRARAYSDSVTNPTGPNTAYTPKKDAKLPLLAPTNVNLEELSGGATARLSWVDKTGNEATYKILQSTDGGSFVEVGPANFTGTGGTMTHDVTGLSTSSTYVFQVFASNAIRDSAITEVTIAAAPKNLTAVRQTGSVRVSWQSQSARATHYRVYRESTGTASLVGTVAATQSHYDDTTVAANTVYRYHVRAVVVGTSTIEGSASQSVEIVVDAKPTETVPVPGGVLEMSRGGDLGEGMLRPHSDSGVRYVDGVVSVEARDLISDGFGMPWGYSRQWTNNAGYVSANAVGNGALNGNGWVIGEMPFLKFVDGEARVALVSGGRTARYFTRQTDGSYSADFSATDELVKDSVDGTFSMGDGNGNVLRFNASGGSGVLQPGGLISHRTLGGVLTTVTPDTSGNLHRPLNVIRTGPTGIELERYAFTYTGSGASSRVQSVTLERKPVGGSYSTVRSVHYEYYDGTTAFGTAGDLKLATVKSSGGEVVDQHYYRYYIAGESGGYAGGLRMAFGPHAAARLQYAHGTNLDAIGNEVASEYADQAFTYDGQRRAASATIAGRGGTLSDGRGVYGFTYGTSGNTEKVSTDPLYKNVWMRVTTETLSDGSQRKTYFNSDGRLMLDAFQPIDIDLNEELPGPWLTYYHFNAQGLPNIKANPDAMSGYDEAEEDLVERVGAHQNNLPNFTYVQDNAGRVERTSYVANGEAAAKFFLLSEEQQGDYGYLGFESPNIMRLEYASLGGSSEGGGGDPGNGKVVSRKTCYCLVALQRPYPEGLAAETDYSYTYYADTKQPYTLTIDYPDGGAITQEVYAFDRFGRTIWFRDGEGSVTRYEYDTASGALTREIKGVRAADYSELATLFPTMVDGPAAATEYGRDALGRVTRVTQDVNGAISNTYVVYDDTAEEATGADPHEVRVYRGWTGTTTTGPVEVLRDHRGAGFTEALLLPAFTGTGTPDGSEAITSSTTPLAISREHVNTAGQVVAQDRYFSTLAYSTSSNLGTEGANFYRTRFGYDAIGLRDREQRPTGTIYRTFFDPQARPVSEWVGTSDVVVAGVWSPLNQTGSLLNLANVRSYEYDKGGVGNGDLSSEREYPSGGDADARVTNYYYDWRRRSVLAERILKDAEGSSPAVRELYWRRGGSFGGTIEVWAYAESNEAVPEVDGYPSLPLNVHQVFGRSTTADPQHFVTEIVEEDYAQLDSSPTIRSTKFAYNKRGQLSMRQDFTTGIGTYDDPYGYADNYVYDGAGRLKTHSLRSGQRVNENGFGVEFERSDFGYDGAGNLLSVTSRQRFHDAVENDHELGTRASTGSTPKARVSYQTFTHDPASRMLSNSNIGTNGGLLHGTATADRAVNDTTLIDASRIGSGVNFAGYTLQVIDGPGAGQTRTVNSYDDLTGTFTLNAALTSAIEGNDTDTNKRSKYLVYDSKALTTTYAYDPIGSVGTVTDPRGIQTVTRYDALGRTIKTIEAFNKDTDDETPEADSLGFEDDDRTTEYTYNGNDDLTSLAALMPDGPDGGSAPDRQTTVYGYGVSAGTGGSNLFSNDLLSEVRYPNKNGDGASPFSVDWDKFTYNALGERKTFTDRNGNIHAYTYDRFGRLAEDRVTTLGSGVDANVNSITFEYPLALNSQVPAARREMRVTGRYVDGSGNATVRNQVLRRFNGFGDVIADFQAHTGMVSTSGSPATPSVRYAYSDEGDNAGGGKRLSQITYPNDRAVQYNYGSGSAFYTGQLQSIDDASGGTPLTLEQYEYLGADTMVERWRPGGLHKLSYLDPGGSGPEAGDREAGDQYAGLDRFGRVIHQYWFGTNTSGEPTSTLDAFRYGYDRNGNRLYRANLVNPAFSELYQANGSSGGYDQLNRLTHFKRGTLNSSNDSITGTAAREQTWNLDALGNWDSITTTVNGGTPATESRSHNRQNQITAVSSTNLTYDGNGNLVFDGSQRYLYDAWNRLVAVSIDGDTVFGEAGDPSYAYDGLNRRISESVAGGATTDFYYSKDWQILEERDRATGHVKAQNIWSPVYIDALIARDRDADDDPDTGNLGIEDSGLEERLYALQDANFNVTALVGLNSSGTAWGVAERYVYDPYGTPTVLNGASGFDADGSVTEWTADTGGASDVGFGYGHQGGRQMWADTKVDFRNRFLLTNLGRWGQQDAYRYVDGANLYEGFTSNPTTDRDPLGLTTRGDPLKGGARPADWDGDAGGGGRGGAYDPYPTYDHGVVNNIVPGANEAFTFQDEMEELYPGDRNIPDAARHIYWQAYLAYRYGCWAAAVIGAAHELHPLGDSDPQDTERDLRNNALGREIGSCAQSLEDMKKKVIDAIEHGEAWGIDGNGGVTNFNPKK